MALNPIHSIDTLTSHYPFGKYDCLHHDLIHHVCKNTAISQSFGRGDRGVPQRFEDVSLMFSLSFFSKVPLFFVSLREPHVQPAVGGRVLLKIDEGHSNGGKCWPKKEG